MSEPTHLDSEGRARMVDVSSRPETARRAVAACRMSLGSAAAASMRSGRAGKGDVAAAARLAGIAAAKRTSELIPLCHPLRTTSIQVDIGFEGETELLVTAVAMGVDRTGFEMEALVAASTAALTVYDMLKVAAEPANLKKLAATAAYWKTLNGDFSNLAVLGIPVHPAAAKYWKERGVDVPTKVVQGY